MLNSELSPFRLITCDDSAATKSSPSITRNDYDVCNLEYILSGCGYLRCAGRLWKLNPGDVYMMRKHESHCYWQDREDPWNKRFLVVDGPLAEQIIANTFSPEEYVFRNCRRLRHYFDAFFTMSKENTGSGAEKALLFHQLAAELASQGEHVQTEVRNLPEHHLRAALEKSVESPFILERYAEESGYTKSYLIRKFRQSFGFTPYDYLLNLKIRKSEELLRYTMLQVKEIADKLGFPDQSSFSRCFRQRTGKTPKQCRKSCLGSAQI